MRSLLVAALLALSVTACAPETPTCDPAPGSSAECSAGIPECLEDGWRLDCDMEPPNPDGSEVCVIVDANGERPAVRQWPLCDGDEPTCSLVGSPVCVVYP